ncbi:siderophore-interacting protein [Shinella sp. BYT-45]|uniref:siderophore-interacting protein n=1 Tax=Shinella sp. BYT-45 TaxID=3377377 RepID=UPI00397FCD33
MTNDETSAAPIVRPENFRIATVLRSERVTPRMQRVSVQVDDLSRFDCHPRSMGPHVHALIPRGDLDRQEWPTADARGHAVYPPPERRPYVRTYSVRKFDYAENSMDIDFVLHGDEGVASRWAAAARIGEEVGLWRPHARILEAEPKRYVLAGDHTALPAIAFILDRLPQTAAGDLLIMVPDAWEEQALRVPPAMTLTWLHGDASQDLLAPAVLALGAQALRDAYLWVGAEAAISRRIRAFARRECGLPAERAYILNYWKRGMAEGSYDHGE